MSEKKSRQAFERSLEILEAYVQAYYDQESGRPDRRFKKNNRKFTEIMGE